MQFVKKFLKPEGKFFLGFPPWHNPFGGHQQICESKVLSKLPFFHILPTSVYRFILKAFGESEAIIRGLLKVKETGITIERFEKILSQTGYKKDNRLFYFINPNYEVKFKLKPRKQLKLFSAIPYFRNFLITTSYYLVSTKNTLPNRVGGCPPRVGASAPLPDTIRYGAGTPQLLCNCVRVNSTQKIKNKWAKLQI
jgi:hypothetical protein